MTLMLLYVAVFDDIDNTVVVINGVDVDVVVVEPGRL